MITYPAIDPVLLSLWGPIQIRWYGLMYLLGFLCAWLLAKYRAKHFAPNWSASDIEDLIFFAAMGVILGGRLGYLLFYSKGQWLDDPLMIFRIWEGGMSFHGGLLGVIIALFVFAKKYQRSFLATTDFAAPLVPLGLAFGRLGNFINGELWGRPTQVPWAMIFPYADELPRHPSQLYAMTLEGFVLFGLVWTFAMKPRQDGQISAVFLIGYAICRIITECFREPDPQWGFLIGHWLTMGQLLSLPLFIFGVYLYWRKPCKPI